MKRVSAIAIVILLIGTSAFAQALSPGDRESAVKSLESTRQWVMNETKNLSADQWNFEPGSGRWSIAEEMEHIAAAEDLYFLLITQFVMKAPKGSSGDDVKAIDQMILAKGIDRSDKAQGRDEPTPTNRFESPEAALSHFLESRDKTIQFLKEKNDLRAHAMDSPTGKRKWDAYQWILFMAAHTDEHLKHILDIKADSNFPKP